MSQARRIVVTLVILGACVTSSASAAPKAVLHAAFDPARLGANTTITISFGIGSPTSPSPSPITGLTLRLPAGVTAGFNTLGVATCDIATLKQRGPRGCSPNALVGRGSAVVSVPLGAETIAEQVKTDIFMAPSVDGHTAMVFYASGTSPVISQMVFPGLLLGDSGLFGAQIDTTIPAVPGVPGAPNAALISMRSQIDPKDLKYYKRIRGVTVAYSPEGFQVPAICPRRGFPFAASFTFADGASEAAMIRVPCPRRPKPGVAIRQSHT